MKNTERAKENEDILNQVYLDYEQLWKKYVLIQKQNRGLEKALLVAKHENNKQQELITAEEKYQKLENKIQTLKAELKQAKLKINEPKHKLISNKHSAQLEDLTKQLSSRDKKISLLEQEVRNLTDMVESCKLTIQKLNEDNIKLSE
eukprot:maker-scaffold_6-snap-gene-11.66-mRNA-1 protein AED:0.00 eAED:0.00 QI:24/1/1/1/1/1/2/826/146